MEDKLEPQRLAVTKLELKIEEFLKKQKSLMFAEPFRARRRIEELRKDCLLNPKTINMFGYVGMMKEYTALLKKFNRVMDGDLT